MSPCVRNETWASLALKVQDSLNDLAKDQLAVVQALLTMLEAGGLAVILRRMSTSCLLMMKCGGNSGFTSLDSMLDSMNNGMETARATLARIDALEK